MKIDVPPAEPVTLSAPFSVAPALVFRVNEQPSIAASTALVPPVRSLKARYLVSLAGNRQTLVL
ncbi:hypothetical protein [Novosphingobium aquae]|uniref:Uncharacterized protein n=1 Tax=Novosphingobium aquae TaxID=3133435 RepID=A0ABU8S5K5_9SPHN